MTTNEDTEQTANLEYERQVKRVRDILSVWVACEKATAGVKGIMSVRKDQRDMWDWKVSVTWALKACGRENAHILIARLTRQQKSQANSWLTIAREVGMTRPDVEAYFNLGVLLFLGEMQRRRIPDHYTEAFSMAA